jgi:hypothetical protein
LGLVATSDVRISSLVVTPYQAILFILLIIIFNMSAKLLIFFNILKKIMVFFNSNNDIF